MSTRVASPKPLIAVCVANGPSEVRKMIVVTFKDVAHLPHGFAGPAGSDTLVIGLKPGTVSLTLTMNAEGDPLDLEQKTLEAVLAPPRMQAYGEVLGQTTRPIRCWPIGWPIDTPRV